MTTAETFLKISQDSTNAASARARCRSALPDRADAPALFHRAHPHPLAKPRGVPEERPRLPGKRRGLHRRGRPALGTGACRGREPARTSSCSIGWTGRGAIWRSRCRSNTARASRPFRCARRCGPIRSRWPWWNSARSRATRSTSSGSTASTTRRCSTSSPISPRPTPSPTPASAGTPTGKITIAIAGWKPAVGKPAVTTTFSPPGLRRHLPLGER